MKITCLLKYVVELEGHDEMNKFLSLNLEFFYAVKKIVVFGVICKHIDPLHKWSLYLNNNTNTS